MRHPLFIFLVSLFLNSPFVEASGDGLGSGKLPKFQSGDLIFQTSNSNQAYAIMWATKSLYSHVGLIEVTPTQTYVIEAIAKVSRTPIEKWIARGRLGRYSVFRYASMTPAQQKAVVASAKGRLGRGYDIYFTGNNREFYCSELIDVAYREAGLAVGEMQKVSELDVDNAIVRNLAEKRWKKHPLCAKGTKTFAACWEKILADKLVTPASLAQDSHLRKISSNYP
jgi:hypothetical protein